MGAVRSYRWQPVIEAEPGVRNPSHAGMAGGAAAEADEDGGTILGETRTGTPCERCCVMSSILLSAYACEPGRGSEPEVGWMWATELAAAGHEVWVITRTVNRITIETALAKQPRSGLHFAYYDLPPRARRWKRGAHGVHL